ncbi:MAG TPA: hypothetical protein VIH42_06905 [Thermoguttaceae bacterium]
MSFFCGDEPVVLRPQPGGDKAIARFALGGREVAKKKAKKKVAKKAATKTAKKGKKKR